MGGRTSGSGATLTIGAAPGPVLEVFDLGATIHRFLVTSGDGVRRNIALGHPRAEDHLTSPHYLGSTVGRYANRIAHGRTQLDGRPLVLATNDRGHHLHGGPLGLDRRPWTLVEHTDTRLVLAVESADGDQGYPGALTAHAAFSVGPDTVRVELTATTDAPTLCNLTSHVYLNLEGHDAGTVDEQTLQVPASAYVPIDASGIPRDGPAPVDGTPFDLRDPVRIGEAVADRHEQMALTGGFDHAFLVDGSGFRRQAVLESSRTRTRLELWSDQPALQVYSGNGLDHPAAPATDGGDYVRRAGIALEPEIAPDAPNRPVFGSAVLRPGETYRHVLEWRLTAL